MRLDEGVGVGVGGEDPLVGLREVGPPAAATAAATIRPTYRPT
jgi:hypothetical protein